MRANSSRFKVSQMKRECLLSPSNLLSLGAEGSAGLPNLPNLLLSELGINQSSALLVSILKKVDLADSEFVFK